MLELGFAPAETDARDGIFVGWRVFLGGGVGEGVELLMAEVRPGHKCLTFTGVDSTMRLCN